MEKKKRKKGEGGRAVKNLAEVEAELDDYNK
jgi:hypothetical protein